jgi:hypothetical protein
VFHSGWVGSWEPTGERSIQFTAVQVLSDANGAYLGTATVHGHPMVSEDGQTFVDADPASTITIRDPAGNVVTVLSGGAPVTATRIGVASDGFPPATPAAATPTA